MHVHSILIVCLRSMSANNGPPETRFPGGAVNVDSRKPRMGYLWIWMDRGLLRFDGFNFRLVSFASIAADSNVPIIAIAYGCWRKTLGSSTGHRSGAPERWQV